MPINPVQFAHSVCDEFLRYIFSAFPLSDPELAEQARKKLKGRSSLDIPLVQGPYVSLSEAFAKGDAQATGVEQVLKLIVNVVERQEERSRTRKARA